MSDIDHRELLLQFIASLTLCDHMGDVSYEITCVLERMGVEVPEKDDGDWLGDVRNEMARRQVTTLHGTSLDEDE